MLASTGDCVGKLKRDKGKNAQQLGTSECLFPGLPTGRKE